MLSQPQKICWSYLPHRGFDRRTRNRSEFLDLFGIALRKGSPPSSIPILSFCFSHSRNLIDQRSEHEWGTIDLDSTPLSNLVSIWSFIYPLTLYIHTSITAVANSSVRDPLLSSLSNAVRNPDNISTAYNFIFSWKGTWKEDILITQPLQQARVTTWFLSGEIWHVGCVHRRCVLQVQSTISSAQAHIFC